MKAFVEWLYKPDLIVPDAVGLLRVGPHAEKYGDPYNGFTVFKIIHGLVDTKGLQNYLGLCPTCHSEIHLSKAHVAAGLHELRRVTGLDIHWTHKGKETVMANIDDPKHPHHIEKLPPGTVLKPSDPSFLVGMDLHQKGHLEFKAHSITRMAENADGSVTDLVTVKRTYSPSPK